MLLEKEIDAFQSIRVKKNTKMNKQECRWAFDSAFYGGKKSILSPSTSLSVRRFP
jgi:hypothetical protein